MTLALARVQMGKKGRHMHAAKDKRQTVRGQYRESNLRWYMQYGDEQLKLNGKIPALGSLETALVQ